MEYYFAVFCQNPSARTNVDATFELRIIEDWPETRLLGLRAAIPAPRLANSLAFFEVEAPVVKPAGEQTDLNIRFRAPKIEASEAIRALVLVGPANLKLVEGMSRPCVGFRSEALARGEYVLPASVCAGITVHEVSIQLSENLRLKDDKDEPLTYTFQITTWSPTVETMVDTFILTLARGAGAAPFLAATAPGFQEKVLGLGPAQLPTLPLELAVPVPQDSVLPPLSTVNIFAGGEAPLAKPVSAAIKVLMLVLACTASSMVPRGEHRSE
jgi:hypothetical protein